MYSQTFQHQNAANYTQQPGLVWNGSVWVSSIEPQSSSAFSEKRVSSYNQELQLAGIAPSPHPLSPPALNPVYLYTQYYHGWIARANAQLKVIEQSSDPSTKEEAKGHYDWFKYFADQASCAAHWFFNHPNVPPSFDLPPDPNPPAVVIPQPVSSPSNRPSILYSQQVDIPDLKPRQQQQLSSPQSSPDGLKRFVDRCIISCQDSNEKVLVMELVEQTIKNALMEGVLHSKDWDAEPTVFAAKSLPAQSNTSDNMDGGVKIENDHSSGRDIDDSIDPPSMKYYGPSTSSSEHPILPPFNEKNREFKSFEINSISKNKKRKAPNATDESDLINAFTNAYGVSTYSHNTHPSFPKQQQQINGSGYYGPSQIPQHKLSQRSEEDFIALPSQKNKYKVLNNMSGFNHSTGTLGHRAKRFAGRGGLSDAAKDVSHSLDFDRFMGKSTIGGSTAQLNAEDYENMKVKGTCLTLEKEYLRLTAPPLAERVRPQRILEKHLSNLKVERTLPNRRDYLWFCSQLKAIRQDCTVQHLRNTFVVDVYETHARVALQEGDLNEYNQCQSQLTDLYQKLDCAALLHRNEFLAYRVLYYVFLTGNVSCNGGSSELFKITTDLSTQERRDAAVVHALQVRIAVADFDYHKFFLLHKSCPNLGSHLMDRIVPSLRTHALHRMCKAYRPTLDVSFALSELGFYHPSENSTDLENGKVWLESCGCVLSNDKATWITKDSMVRDSGLDAQRKQI